MVLAIAELVAMTLLAVLPVVAAAAIFIGTFRTRPGSRLRKPHRLATAR